MKNIYKDFLGQTQHINCMACDISEGKIIPPYGLLEETKCFIVHHDPYIPIPGFLIISTKRHIFSFADMNEEELKEISILLHRYTNALKKIDSILHTTIIQEEKSKEGHFHLWLFPWHDFLLNKYKPTLKNIRRIMRRYRKNKRIINRTEEIFMLIRKVNNQNE